MLTRFQLHRGTRRSSEHDRQTDTRGLVFPIGRTRSDPARCNGPPAQPAEGYSAICTMRSGSHAEKARPGPRDLQLPGRPWWNPEHSLVTMQHRKGKSFLLLEYCLEDDVLEAIERGRTAFDLHPENCALPGGKQEFGEIHRI